MKQNKPFDSKILLIILGAILALLLFSCTNQRPAIQTVTFDANGGKLSGEASVTVFTGFPVSEPKAPTRSGYSFSGWYLEGSSTKYDFSSPVFSDITLKAQWNKTSSPTSYTVTYHALVDGMESDAITVPNPTAAQSGSTLSTPDEPTYNETTYFFVGWSTSDTEYAALASDHIVQGNLDLWAVFVTKTSSQITSADNKLSFAFDKTKRGYTVKAGTVATGEVVIPSTIKGAPVVEIEADAFRDIIAITAIDLSGATNLKTIGDLAFYKTGITSLTIPGNVETVGGWIVEGCSSLSRITLEEGVKNLSQSSFYGAAVKSIKIPSTITEIPAYCFEASAIESIELHDGIASIGDGAFFNCSALTELTIPRSVKSIGQWILQIGSKDSNDNWTTDSNASIKVVIEEGATGLSNESFWGAPISLISIPSTITEIPELCFAYSTVEEVKTAGTIKTIGINAFLNCSDLTTFDLTGVEIIGERAFAHTGITNVYIPASVATVGYGAFENGETIVIDSIPIYKFDEGDSLTVTFEEGFDGLITGSFYGAPIDSISIPESVTIIPSHCFQNATLLTRVTLHKDITEIQPYAFSNTGIKEITLPAKLEKIDNFAFADCALTALSLPEGLTYIGEKAFMSNQITGTLGIPASVMEIGPRAFYDTNISGIEFKEGANLTIRSEAFASTTNLRDVMFPSLTATLYIDAFSYSINHSSNSEVGLHSITVQADKPAHITLLGTSANAMYCTIYVPDEAIDYYKASTTNWCAQNRFDADNIEPVSNKPTS